VDGGRSLSLLRCALCTVTVHCALAQTLGGRGANAIELLPHALCPAGADLSEWDDYEISTRGVAKVNFLSIT
jgi:hypothetical protein